MKKTTGTIALILTVLASGILLAGASPASAEGYPPGPGPTVAPQPPTPVPPAVKPVKVVKAPSPVIRVGRIALTGADVLRWALAGAAFVVVGTSLVVMSRRRVHAART